MNFTWLLEIAHSLFISFADIQNKNLGIKATVNETNTIMIYKNANT